MDINRLAKMLTTWIIAGSLYIGSSVWTGGAVLTCKSWNQAHEGEKRSKYQGVCDGFNFKCVDDRNRYQELQIFLWHQPSGILSQ